MDTPRRLLCVFPWLAMGGADKFNLDLLRALRTHGWAPQILTTLPGTHPWRAAFEALAPVHDLGSHAAAERPAALLAAAGAAQPEVVLISGSWLAYDLLPALRAQLPDTAFVDYNHMELPAWRNGGYPRASLERAAQLELQIVSSAHLRRWMLAHGADPAQVHVCYTGVDTALWDPASYDRAAVRRRLGLDPDAFVTLFVGRLEAQKQPTLLAGISATICRRLPQARVLIAGDGTYQGFLRAFVRHRGLATRVALLGAVDNAGVGELLAASDLLLLPSAYEGISLALYEAMAMGVPVIATAVGGQGELVTPDCGLLLPPPANAAAYAEAILALAADPARRRAMGAASRRRVHEQFSLAQLGSSMDQLLALAARLRRERPAPAVTPGAAAASLRLAATNAAAHDAEAQTYRSARSPRGAARALYRRLLASGAWWLAPLVDRLRRP